MKKVLTGQFESSKVNYRSNINKKSKILGFIKVLLLKKKKMKNENI
jgi:hypothetical protein